MYRRTIYVVLTQREMHGMVRNIVCPIIPNYKIYLITPTSVILYIREY